MTGTIRGALAVLPLALGLSGCVWFGWKVEDRAPFGFEDERSEVQIVTTNVGGKNFFKPVILNVDRFRRLETRSDFN